MDRDRDRDRDRRDDSYSNTYRPRSPGPRIDSYRGRSPPRRGLYAADTYTPGGASRAPRPRSRSPGGFRRRSRSPPRRDDDRWRARPRSPPPRGYSPRRDDYRSDRGRSPSRYDSYSGRRSSRGPRDRSPLPRDRDLSPARSRGYRSPPRVNRYDEPRSRAHSPYRRTYSPPRDSRDYRRRSPSPRRDRVDPYTADTWRRRSPSPRPQYASNDASGRESVATSRRSSPPGHSSRPVLVADDRSARDREPISAPRSPYREREDRDRERDFDRDRDYGRERSPPRHRETPPTGPREREYGTPSAPPTGPSSYRNGDTFGRAPPTGPSARSYPSPAISPPVGPSSSAAPTYPRVGNPALAAPTRPRGGSDRGGFGRGAYTNDYPRDFSGPSPRRGSWGGGRGGYHGGPPTGPRGGAAPSFAPPFRGSTNSTSTTYPRTQRFRDHLTDLPKEVPGGQPAPELFDKSKINKLEEEAQRLRDIINQKEQQKRAQLREWQHLEREGNNASLRADLAEQQLRSLNGDGETGGAAF